MPASRFGTPRKYPCASTLRSNSFSFTHFRKNASATPLVSHTFKTKDLKPFRFTHFQKNGGGWVPLSNIQPHTSNLCSSLTDHPARMVVPSEHRESRDLSLYVSPLDSALTSKRAPKSFASNTYEKHTGGRGVHLLSTLDCQLSTHAVPLPHQAPVPLLCFLPTPAHSARFPFRSGRGRRLFSWPPRSRWKESRALLRFEQASPATGRSGSSRRRSRDGRRGVCGNALRRPPHRRSSHIPSPGRSAKRRRRVWRRRTLPVSGGASWRARDAPCGHRRGDCRAPSQQQLRGDGFGGLPGFPQPGAHRRPDYPEIAGEPRVQHLHGSRRESVFGKRPDGGAKAHYQRLRDVCGH